MKLSMAKSSPMTTKIITLISIILVTVGLIQHASITINANDVTDEYQYKLYGIDPVGAYHVFLSDAEIVNERFNGYYENLTTGIEAEFAGKYWSTTIQSGQSALHLYYIDGTWSYELPSVLSGTVPGLSRISLIFYPAGTITTYTTKPSNFPAITNGLTHEDVNDLIDSALNDTTSITTSANNIQMQATNAYISYSNGNMTLSQLQTTIDNLSSQLQTLNNNNSATIADKIAINNAITQTQIVQDAANKDAIITEMEQDLTVSSSVSTTITGKINQANQAFNQYSQGTITQTEAITQINQYITQLTQIITPQTPTADIEAINAGINTINGIKDSIKDYSELDPSISEEQVSSDEEELELLNEMMSVMQEQDVENKMEDQQIAGQAGNINTVLEPLWNNKYMTYLVGVSGVLILACIVLHTKYRML